MLTHKQDTFARHVATGLSQHDAYLAAYDATNMLTNTVYVEACRLAANPKVAQRIEQLREAAWKAEHVTRQSVIHEAMEASRHASENGRHAAAVRGLEIAGKMLGAI
jgi:phage terminase small subunit